MHEWNRNFKKNALKNKENLKIYFVSLFAEGKYVQGWVIFSCSRGAS